MNYAIITPARNEESYIQHTLESVVRQKVRPVKWLIVSDGSTDRTDEIVSSYASRHDWIELMRMPERDSRDFSGKAGCFNAGYAHLTRNPALSPTNPQLPDERTSGTHSALRTPHSAFDAIVSLDADLSFDEQYFSFLLQKLVEDPKLGIVGTPFSENGETYDYRFSSAEYVSGACQVFRRECFDAIGGYTPLKGGGIDVVAVQTARLLGWKVRTFPEKACIHHRQMGSANHKDRLIAAFKLGRRAYTLGWHPVWQIFRSAYQMTKKPYITGGSALFCGYFWSMICRVEQPVSGELVAFQRQEQMKRLRAFFATCFGRKTGGANGNAPSLSSRVVTPAK